MWMPKIGKVTYEPIDKDFRNGWRLILSDGNIVTESYALAMLKLTRIRAGVRRRYERKSSGCQSRLRLRRNVPQAHVE